MSLETLDGTITAIMHHQPPKWSPRSVPFLIAKVNGGQTIKGKMKRPVLGACYRFYGTWQKARPPYPGMEFCFDSFEAVIDRSTAGMAVCLADQVVGIGAAKGNALVEAFGDDTFDVLRETPERALEVKGITPEIVENIKEFFRDNQHAKYYAELMDMFSGHRFPKSIVNKLLELFPGDAPEAVRKNPYLLLAFPRCGWIGVDAFATTKMAYDVRGQKRQKAGVLEAFHKLEQDGHTYGHRSEIECLAYGLLGYMPDQETWHALIQEGEVSSVDDDCDSNGLPKVVALTDLANAEATIAERIADLSEAVRPISFRLDGEGFNLDQIKAAELIQEHGVAILSGLPGVGKSWVTARIIAKLTRRGFRVRVAAPTGKAAKRMRELLDSAGVDEFDVPATTIHKMLFTTSSNADDDTDEQTGNSDEFVRNEGNPLDLNVLVLDECSMIDARLMASALRAVPNGARVLFVGDPDQLPSIGAGSVLRDMIDAGVPTASLTKIMRSNPGRVIKACHAIHDGLVPEPADDLDPDAGDNWIHIEAHDGDLAGSFTDLNSIEQEIVSLYEIALANRNRDPLWDMQVISAQKEKHPFACANLNRVLCRLLNPRAAKELANYKDGFEPPFVAGDKVLRTKNGGGLVNGDLGQVLDITVSDRDSEVSVQFRNPDRTVCLKYEECHLKQAYAVTVHSAQGSGFPVVIVPVSLKFYWDQRAGTGLFSKELLYTAMSRTERILITVGPFAAIRAAVGRPTKHQRRTTLKARLVSAFARIEATATS